MANCSDVRGIKHLRFYGKIINFVVLTITLLCAGSYHTPPWILFIFFLITTCLEVFYCMEHHHHPEHL